MNLFDDLEFRTLFLINLVLSIIFYFVNQGLIVQKIKNRIIQFGLLYVATPFMASIPLAIVNLSLYYNKNNSPTYNISESLGASLGTLAFPYVLFLLIFGIISFIKKTYK